MRASRQRLRQSGCLRGEVNYGCRMHSVAKAADGKGSGDRGGSLVHSFLHELCPDTRDNVVDDVAVHCSCGLSHGEGATVGPGCAQRRKLIYSHRGKIDSEDL